MRGAMNYTEILDETLFAGGTTTIDLNERGEFREVDMRDIVNIATKREENVLGKRLQHHITEYGFRRGVARFISYLDGIYVHEGNGNTPHVYAVVSFRNALMDGLKHEGVRYGTTDLYRIIAEVHAEWDAEGRVADEARRAAEAARVADYDAAYGKLVNPKNGKKLVTTVVENVVKNLPTVGTVYADRREIRLDTSAHGGNTYDRLDTIYLSVSKGWGDDMPALDTDAILAALTAANFINLGSAADAAKGTYSIRAKVVAA